GPTAYPPTPLEIPLDLPATQIAVGHMSACARMIDATIRCWGISANGDVAPGLYWADSSDFETTLVSVPQSFPEIRDVDAVAHGEGITCVMHRGDVDCWGQNFKGALTSGLHPDDEVTTSWFHEPTILRPVRQALPERARSIAVRLGTLCAIGESRSVYCWGWNNFGQAGAGSPPFCFASFDFWDGHLLPGCDPHSGDVAIPTR